MIQNEKMVVISQREIAEHIFELTLKGELVASIKEPGQFVHVKTSDSMDPLLRRPISISSFNRDEKTFTMIYRAEGRGTTILSMVQAGQTVDVLGPLGHGFPVHKATPGDTALLIGGGIGVPPLYELSKSLVANDVRVIHVLGFQTAAASFYEEEFSALGDTYIATVDGTNGTKGFVTDVISEKQFSINIFYSCGPTPMLKAVEKQLHDKEGYISLEQRMGCGIGACFACVCHLQNDPTGTSYIKVCSDGPVFSAGEVLL